jgi:large subunit ribosomal protein L21
MYAIIRSGSKQYRVKKGDVIEVDAVQAAPGEMVEFRDVLLLSKDKKAAQIGSPFVAGSLVKGKFLAMTKGPKIMSVKYKQRKNQRRKFGHRQKYAQVEIVDIVG